MLMKELTKKQIKNFQKFVCDEAKKVDENKFRSNLPWRKNITPYKILVSEIMLQQTQVARVVDFFNKWLEVFPDFESLARASTSDVLRMWKGLGYNNRGLRLQKLAQMVVSTNSITGPTVTEPVEVTLPKTKSELEKLPGIGPYTAGAIMAFAYNKPEVFIETNIRRVFIHHFFPDEEGISDKQLFPLITQTLDIKKPRKWYWALMDYGSQIPKQEKFNPNKQSKHYTKQSKFAGSVREMRSLVTQFVLNEKQGVSFSLLKKKFGKDERFEQAFSGLVRDGILRVEGKKVLIGS